MADGQSRTDDGVPNPVHDLISQLRGVSEKLTGLMGLTGLAGIAESLPIVPGLPSLPRPAALSAAQLKAMSSTVAAQRLSIEAMQAQLRSFDDQLSVMEKILEPVTEWTTALADLEKTLLHLRPGADG
jgi:uncharacterized coiled-coil protein SlyX